MQEARERQANVTEMRGSAQALRQALGGMDSALRNVAGRLQEGGHDDTSRAFAQLTNGVIAAEAEAVQGSSPDLLREAQRGYEAAVGISQDRAQSTVSMVAINEELSRRALSPREARAITHAILASEAESYQPPISNEERDGLRMRTLDLRNRLTEQQVSLLALYAETQPRDEANPDRATGTFIRNANAIPYSDMVRLYRDISRTGGLDKQVWNAVYARLTSGGRNPNLTPDSFDRTIAGLETTLPLVVIDEGERMAQEQSPQTRRAIQREADLQNSMRSDGQARPGAHPEPMPNLRQALHDYNLPNGPEREAAEDGSPNRNLYRALRNYDPPRTATPETTESPTPQDGERSHHRDRRRHHRH